MEIFSQPKRTVFFQNALFLCKKERFSNKKKIYKIYSPERFSSKCRKSPPIGDDIWSATNRPEKYLQNRLKPEKEWTRL